MKKMLDGLPCVMCIMDDIILFGDSHEEHDARVKAVLKRLEENGMTLNYGKCDFAKFSVSYLGHVVSAQGIEQKCKRSWKWNSLPTRVIFGPS